MEASFTKRNVSFKLAVSPLPLRKKIVAKIRQIQVDAL